jgi:hypothetical protein
MYLLVEGAHLEVNVAAIKSYQETGYKTEATIVEIKGFLRRRLAGTLKPRLAQKIGKLRQSLASQLRRLVTTNKAWRT